MKTSRHFGSGQTFEAFWFVFALVEIVRFLRSLL